MDDKEQQTTTKMIDDNAINEENKEKHANDDNDDNTNKKVEITTYKFAARIKIRADNKQQAYNNHKHLMETIGTKLKHLHLYSKNNKIVDPKKIVSNQFEYHEAGKQTKYFIVVHGMESNNTYHQIKWNKQIFQCLQTTNCYIQQHLWSEEEWNIITIGFLSRVSPKH